MTEPTRNRAARHATCAAITLVMSAWLIFGAVMNAGAGDFPRGF